MATKVLKVLDIVCNLHDIAQDLVRRGYKEEGATIAKLALRVTYKVELQFLKYMQGKKLLPAGVQTAARIKKALYDLEEVRK